MTNNQTSERFEQDLAEYERRALSALKAITDRASLDAWHQANLARKGEAMGWPRLIGSLAAEERPAMGKLVKGMVDSLEEAYAAARDRAEAVPAGGVMVDVTEPPRHRRRGSVHPVTAMLEETLAIFASMGFTVFDSPHVELDEFNFGLLNMAPHHPARDMQDTFYVRSRTEGANGSPVLMRTHTSAGQVRAMRAVAPKALRVVIPGRCYRNEDVTPRAEMQFHQVEGLMVGPDVRLSDLKGLLLVYARHVFGTDQDVRVRASYFPFTEPSVEIDIQCTLCGGAGCRVCKNTGWLEMLGGGLVHPVVLRNGGYDPEKVRGIAWGMGVERPLLLRHQISDIRQFFRNDLHFLGQFR